MKFNLIFLSFLFPIALFSQNVGIGTNNPSAPLDIVGDLEVNGGMDVFGAPSSTITSTNGEITLKAGSTTLTIKPNGNIVIDAMGDISLTSSGDIDLNGVNINLNASNLVNIDGQNIDMDAQGSATMDGAVILLNGGGSPAARQSDTVVTPALPVGSIVTGSSSVFIGG